MRTRPDADQRNHEEGSAAVEFALVLPLVLVVLLALVQVGLVVRDRVLVEAAARAGARVAAIVDDQAAIEGAAMDAAPSLDPALATVEVTRAGTRGDPVSVRIVYNDPVRLPLVAWLVGDGVTMTSTAVTRQEFA
jgi:Flp pilus assembly protein TadG